jgi:hypothetical protein
MVKAGNRISSCRFQQVMRYRLSQEHLVTFIVIMNDVQEMAPLFLIVSLPQLKSRFSRQDFLVVLRVCLGAEQTGILAEKEHEQSVNNA